MDQMETDPQPTPTPAQKPIFKFEVRTPNPVNPFSPIDEQRAQKEAAIRKEAARAQKQGNEADKTREANNAKLAQKQLEAFTPGNPNLPVIRPYLELASWYKLQYDTTDDEAWDLRSENAVLVMDHEHLKAQAKELNAATTAAQRELAIANKAVALSGKSSSTLRKERTAWEKEKTEFQKEIAGLNESIKTLTAPIDSNASDSAAAASQPDLDTITPEQIRQLHESHVQTMTELQVMKGNVVEAQTAKRKAEDQAAWLDSEFNAFLTSKGREVERLNTTVERLKTELQQKQEEAKSQNAELQQKREEVKSLNANPEVLQQIEKQAAEITTIRKECSAEVALFQQRYEAELGKLKKSHKAEMNKAKESHVAEMNRSKESHQVEMEKLKKTQKVVLDHELKKLRDQYNAEVTQQQTGLANEIKKLQDQYNAEVAQHQTGLTTDASERMLKFETSMREQFEIRLMEMNKIHEEELSQKESEINSRNESLIAGLRNDITQCNEKIEALEVHSQRLSEEEAKAQLQVKTKDRKLEELTKKNEQQYDEIGRFIKTIHQFEENKSKIYADVRATEKKSESLEETLGSVTEEKETLQKKKNELSSENEKLKKETRKLAAEKAELQETRNGYESAMHDMTADLDGYKSEANAAREQIEDLQQLVSQLQMSGASNEATNNRPMDLGTELTRQKSWDSEPALEMVDQGVQTETVAEVKDSGVQTDRTVEATSQAPTTEEIEARILVPEYKIFRDNGRDHQKMWWQQIIGFLIVYATMLKNKLPQAWRQPICNGLLIAAVALLLMMAYDYIVLVTRRAAWMGANSIPRAEIARLRAREVRSPEQQAREDAMMRFSGEGTLPTPVLHTLFGVDFWERQMYHLRLLLGARASPFLG